MPSLKRETALWWVLFLGVVAARTLNLGLIPLNDVEAASALAAWSVSRGEAFAFANPLLVALQAQGFSMLGSGNVLARLPGALAGAALAISPWWGRASLGRLRAWIFAALLAISPTAWYDARVADGSTLGWALAATVFMLWLSGRTRALPVLVGLLCATGRDAVLPSLFVVIALAVRGDLGAFASIWRARTSAAVTGLVFVAASCGLFLNPPGIGAAFSGAAGFFSGLFTRTGMSFARFGVGILTAEALLFGLGLAGAVLAVLTPAHSRADRAWLAWVAVGLALLAVPALRGVDAALGLVFGLAALGSAVLDTLLARAAEDMRRGFSMVLWSSVGLCTLVLLFAAASAIQFTAQGALGWLLSAAVAALAITGICLMMAVSADVAVPFRGALIGLTLCGCIYGIGTGFNLAIWRANNPAEPYVQTGAGDDLGHLQRSLALIGTRADGDPSALNLTVDASAPPSLRWVLRDVRNVTYTALPGSDSALLLPAGLAPTDGGAYLGDAYSVSTSASLRGVTCRQFGDRPDCTPITRWLLRRQVDNLQTTQWVLWLRSDTSALFSGRR